MKVVLYRIVQEQLNNIVNHSAAYEVEIELRQDTEGLILRIDDNGKGFDMFAKKNGIGFKNIKNRAEIYNGVVHILSSPGNGCKMKIVFKSNN